MTRVIKIEKNGGPEVLEVKNIEVRDPRPDQVLIENKAIGLNYIDNNPNLILLYESEEFNQEFHFTYEVNNAELNLHQSLKIQWDGDSTNCNSNINTITVTDIPETSNP